MLTTLLQKPYDCTSRIVLPSDRSLEEYFGLLDVNPEGVVTRVAYQTVSPDIFRFTGARVDRESARWNIVAAGERIVARIIFVLMLPVLVAAGIVVVLLSHRSPLVSQSRVGRGGENSRC